MKFLKPFDLPLLLILSVAILFRFYNFLEYQYWSIDEELLTATVRHIIWDRSPSLLVQNVQLGFGLGPFYHWLLVPFFIISQFNLVLLFAVPSLLGLVTTLLVYWGGAEIGGRRLGLLAGFIYASSFLIALFDRRLHHLTLNSFIAALTFLSLAKIVSGNYKYLPLLALSTGFAFHSDPSLLVLVMGIIGSWILFKWNLKTKYFIYTALLLSIFFLPFILAELKYNGAVVNSVIGSLTRPIRGVAVNEPNLSYFSSVNFIDVLTRTLFTAPNDFIELQFDYSYIYPKPLFSPVSQFVLFGVLAYGLFLFLFRKQPIKYQLAWVFFLSFILGAIIFNRIFKGNFYQHYFTVLFPIFIVLFAQTLLLISKRVKLLLPIFLSVYFIANLYSLLNSTVKYPLIRS